MYIPTPPKLQLFLISWTKERFGPFDSLEDIYLAMRKARLRISGVGDEISPVTDFFNPWLADSIYIIRTSNGTPVPAKDFHFLAAREEKKRLAERQKIFRPRSICRDGDFRREPVAHTGKRSWRGYYRRIHTFGEHKAAAAANAEGFGRLVRPARNLSMLAESWDDIRRGRERNWKRQRRHQWKENCVAG